MSLLSTTLLDPHFADFLIPPQLTAVIFNIRPNTDDSMPWRHIVCEEGHYFFLHHSRLESAATK